MCRTQNLFLNITWQNSFLICTGLVGLVSNGCCTALAVTLVFYWGPYAPAIAEDDCWLDDDGVSGVSVVLCSCVEESDGSTIIFVPLCRTICGLGRVGRGVTVCVVVVPGCGSNYAHQESWTRITRWRLIQLTHPPPFLICTEPQKNTQIIWYEFFNLTKLVCRKNPFQKVKG